MPNPLYQSFFQQHRDSEAPLMIREDGSRLSYREFLDIAARFANTLVTCGVKPGDRVVLQVPKSAAEALAVYAACVQSGSVMVPLNTGYTADEVDYFVGDAKPKLVICDPKNKEGLESICEKHSAQLETLDAIGEGSFASLQRSNSKLSRWLNDRSTTWSPSSTPSQAQPVDPKALCSPRATCSPMLKPW